MTAQVLAPVTITDSSFLSCSVAEPDSLMGETLWIPATNYAIGDEVVRLSTHRIYTCLASGIDAGTPEATPLRWLDTRPTNKWAAFDIYRSTAIKASTTISMVLRPGIVTGMAFFGLVGDSLRVVCRDTTTMVAYYDETVSLANYLSGDLMWEFYFGTPMQQDSYRIADLYPRDAQVEITLTVSTTTNTAEIGIFAPGSFESIGQPQYGFKAQPVDYSRIKSDAYGNTEIIPGLSAKNITGECLIPTLLEATSIAETIYRQLGKPCAWVITDTQGYDYLNSFGLGSADVTATGPNHAMLSLTIRGLI